MNVSIVKNKNINNYIKWPIWECEPSKFDWEYDSEEHCYIFKGKVTIYAYGKTYELNEGDYVVFPKNMKCVWEVHSKIKKYYKFI